MLFQDITTCASLKRTFKHEIMNIVVCYSGHFKLLGKVIFKEIALKKKTLHDVAIDMFYRLSNSNTDIRLLLVFQ